MRIIRLGLIKNTSLPVYNMAQTRRHSRNTLRGIMLYEIKQASLSHYLSSSKQISGKERSIKISHFSFSLLCKMATCQKGTKILNKKSTPNAIVPLRTKCDL